MGSCSEQLTEQQCQLTERQARVDARGKLLGHSEFQLAHSKFQKPSETPQEVSRPLNTSLGGVLRHILSEIPSLTSGDNCSRRSRGSVGRVQTWIRSRLSPQGASYIPPGRE